VQALGAFQRDRGLSIDGIAGPLTRHALDRAERVPFLADVCHGDHALYQQTLAGVHRLDARSHRVPDQRSEQLAAALVVEAKRAGLQQIDEVNLGRDAERVFAVQKGSHAVFDRNAYVDTMPALNQPIARSSEQLEQVNQNRAQQAMAAEMQLQQAPERSHGFSR
jgi:putative chitinase